jgi:hypothetical protein
MKKTFLFILAAFLLSSLNSCDPCKKKDCGPYGNCDNGSCDCECGTSKDSNGSCTVNERDPYIGSYSTSGTSSSGGSFSNFDLRCNAGTAFNAIEFDMSEIGFPKFKGKKDCSQTIAFETVDNVSTGDTFNGTCSRSGNILTIVVRQNTSIGSEVTYTFTANKQ